MTHQPQGRSVDAQIAALGADELKCLQGVREENESHKLKFDDEMMLRICRAKKFDQSRCVKLHFNYRLLCKAKLYHELTVDKVATQLRTSTLLIPRGVTDAHGNQVLYMNCAKYFPGKNDLDALLQSMVYLLNDMTRDEKTSCEGIAFMANMEDWGWSNFGARYAKNFFDMMQGAYPLRVRSFLIMNPPSWFGMVWRIIRPMMSAKFAAKVHIVSGSDEIAKHVGGEDSQAWLRKLESEGDAREKVYADVIEDFITESKKREQENGQ